MKNVFEVSNNSKLYISKAQEKATSIYEMQADAEPSPIRHIGIIGAGTMGGGIAMNFANVGLPVTVVEAGQRELDYGLAAVRRNYERSMNRGRFSQDILDQRLELITGTLEAGDVANCDLVIEAVYEDLNIKKSVFRLLDKIVKPNAILATNSSGLDINEIANVTSRPESVIGLHFFSPANVMKLLEVVRGAKTAPSVIAASMKLATAIGKIPVLVGVCPGFVGNRMLWPRQVRAQALLARGAMPWDVDRVIKNFGFKMGPFEMADLAGLDIGWSRGAVTLDRIRDALCEIDRRGQKTMAGYYDYDENRIGRPSTVVQKLLRHMLRGGGDSTPISDQDILEACLFPLVNEGVKILEEKIAQRPSDIDLVWVFGYGWPAETGGPMRWADTVGLERILSHAKKLALEDNWYAPAPLLKRLVTEGMTLEGMSNRAER